MIGHLAKAMDDAMVAVAHQCKHIQPGTAINVVAVDQVALVAARGDMVYGTRKFESKWSRHLGKGTELLKDSAEIAQLCARRE
jgi:hypothetical protein